MGLRGLAALGRGKRAKAPGQEQPRDQCGWSQGSEGKKEGSESGGWDREEIGEQRENLTNNRVYFELQCFGGWERNCLQPRHEPTSS